MSDLIDRYPAGLRQALRGDPDLTKRILCELEAHLSEGAEREQECGIPAEEAQRRAFERFGPPNWWHSSLRRSSPWREELCGSG
jgi:hypothetical protein